MGSDAAPLELAAKALPESKMLEQGYNSQLPKYQLTASTIQGPATKAGSAEQQSHIQQLSRKTKQKDHCFFSCRLGLGKQ